MDVANHVAVVTGAASGLGAATARALAAAGAKVGLFDVAVDGLAAVAKETGGLAVECDVTDGPSAEAAVARVAAELGEPRIAVNCAGIAPAEKIVNTRTFEPASLENFRRVVEVNLLGSFNISRLVAVRTMQLEPLDETGERGLVLYTASIAAFEGQIGQAAYAASKGGLVSMTLVAAREFARSGIRVVTIAPGLMSTPMLLGFPQEVQDSLAAQVPFPQRFGRPEEYSDLVMSVIGNQMINGCVLRLDGAIRMQAR